MSLRMSCYVGKCGNRGRQAAPVGMAFIFYLFDFRIVKLIVGSLFVLFAALEASCRFCIACKIYPLIYGM